jgi:putative ABC transport system substrate-binding protein
LAPGQHCRQRQQHRYHVEAGGLMSYGADTVEMFAMLGEQVAQILAGTRPADVPVRRATRFYLVTT